MIACLLLFSCNNLALGPTLACLEEISINLRHKKSVSVFLAQTSFSASSSILNYNLWVKYGPKVSSEFLGQSVSIPWVARIMCRIDFPLMFKDWIIPHPMHRDNVSDINSSQPDFGHGSDFRETFVTLGN